GNVNRNVADGLLVALERSVPVVVATRCRRGEPTPIYGGPGGFATLHAAGALSSMGLSAGKARLTLQATIAAGGGAGGGAGDPARIRSCFERLATLR
ncbi:MAG: hypothetical protein ACK4V6_20845, partial [Microthrixaceae bacterium]